MTSESTQDLSTTPIVLFDGECHLCDFSVRFILKHERDHAIRFAPLQSDIGRELVNADDMAVPDSVVYIEGERTLFCSDAAIAIATHLKAPWRWAGLIRILPRPVRDPLYRLVASNRYGLFGRKDVCEIPTALTQDRLLTKD